MLQIMPTPELVERVLLSIEDMHEINEDGVDFISGFNQFVSDNHWLSFSIENIAQGVIRITRPTESSLNIHPYMPKKYRKNYKKLIFEFFQLFIEKLNPILNKVSVTIPFTRKKVYNCAINVGFVEEGIDRQSFYKNGVYHDRWILGITRSEVEEILNGRNS